jgi:hypothetical protein
MGNRLRKWRETFSMFYGRTDEREFCEKSIAG